MKKEYISPDIIITELVEHFMGVSGKVEEDPTEKVPGLEDDDWTIGEGDIQE